MSLLRAYQPSFIAGELAPALWARVDLSKYSSGLKTAINLFIHPHGGASNRAGFQFVREIKDSEKKATLIPFEFNTEQTYILEFGDLYIRIFRDGGLIEVDDAPYEVVTTYTEDQVGDLVFAQEADVMYICHPEHPVQKLSRTGDAAWTLEDVTFAPKTEKPTGLGGSAFFTRRIGSNDSIAYRITAVNADGAESLASNGVTVSVQYSVPDGRMVRLAWNAVDGATLYRVYRSNTAIGILAETTETTIDLDVGLRSGDGTLVPTEEDSGAPSKPLGLTGKIIFGKEIEYVVAAVDDESGEESLPSDPFTLINDLSYQGNRNLLSWDAVAGASAYIIYKKDNGQFGYIGRSETTNFTDENITPDLSDGPQQARNPFDGDGNYPRSVTFIEQRLAFSSTKNEPQACWLSQSANYENFGYSQPSKASDAVTFRIRARQVNQIRSMIPARGLMIFTSGAEWIVSGGSQSDAISPSAIKIDNQGYRGAAKVQPIVVGNTVLFAQRLGGVVRDFSYEFAQDAFVGRDLTILARHLFENKEIVSWAYAQAPYSMCWVVLDDGSLCTLTYLKEHEVWAWTRHESGADAYFEHVAVVPEGKEDVPYFIVRRTIGNQQHRYIERLHTRVMDTVADAFFVDSGLTYIGDATKIITGLDHLLGQEVVALADGNVVRGLTVEAVDGGVGVTLPNAAAKVHIGLPMTATLQTLDLDLGNVQGLGTVQGRKKSVPNIVMRVEKTRGIFVGPKDGERNSTHLVEYKQRKSEPWGEAIDFYTGDISITPQWDWTDGGNMFIKQFDPLPMTILAAMPDVTVARS